MPIWLERVTATDVQSVRTRMQREYSAPSKLFLLVTLRADKSGTLEALQAWSVVRFDEFFSQEPRVDLAGEGTATDAQSVTKMGHWVLSAVNLLCTLTSPSSRDPVS